MLIFDEVMTGFRVSRGGAAARYGVTPDLITLGKIIGGGLPLAAFGGSRSLMQMVAPEGPVYQAGTFAAHPLAIAAGLAMLDAIDANVELYNILEARGAALESALTAAASEAGVPVSMQRVASMWTMFFSERPIRSWDDADAVDRERYARFFRAMLGAQHPAAAVAVRSRVRVAGARHRGDRRDDCRRQGRPARGRGVNDRFLRACRRQPVDRTPLWIMRQAGRYLPEYREVRSRHDFLTVCRTPELAAEVTLQPLRRFKMDAAILFSDIMVPLDAFGIPMTFEPGPKIADPIRTRAQVDRLEARPAADAVPFVADAIRLLRRELDGRTPLIGFCGAPFTIAAYLVQGEGKEGFSAIKRLMYREPGDARSAPRKTLRGDGRLPAPADRRRRAGGADLRFVGRHPRRGGLSPFRAAGREVPGRHGARARRAEHLLPQRRAAPDRGRRRRPAGRARRLLARIARRRSARASRIRSRCRATSIRMCCSPVPR